MNEWQQSSSKALMIRLWDSLVVLDLWDGKMQFSCEEICFLCLQLSTEFGTITQKSKLGFC
jgi:hypothetical protein